MKEQRGEYIAVVEGSIPDRRQRRLLHDRRRVGARHRARGLRQRRGDDRDRHLRDLRRHSGRAPNPTGALGVADAVPGVKNLINLSACPANVENLTALLVYYLTFKRWPPLDHHRRPLFAYGKSIHDNCERRAHYDAGQYVEAWGDEGHRAGLLPLQDGLQGPGRPSRTVPNVRWNGGTNWPIGCGHPCIGCAEPDFWDTMTPFYQHLTGVPGFGVGIERRQDRRLRRWLGVGAAFAGHGLIQIMKRVGDKSGTASRRSASRSGGQS